MQRIKHRFNVGNMVQVTRLGKTVVIERVDLDEEVYAFGGREESIKFIDRWGELIGSPEEPVPTDTHTTTFTIEHKYAVGDTLVWDSGSEETIKRIIPLTGIGNGAYSFGNAQTATVRMVDNATHVKLKPKETPMVKSWMVLARAGGRGWSWIKEPKQESQPTGATCFIISGTIENPTIERVW